MTYVFDTSSLIDMFQHYYRSRFPSLWDKFDQVVESKRIISVREVHREIPQGNDNAAKWTASRKNFFHSSTKIEMEFVAEIFKVPRFQALVTNKNILSGRPVADPFIIAKTHLMHGCVVTQESQVRDTKIPKICEHFHIRCLDLEGFMEREDWTF